MIVLRSVVYVITDKELRTQNRALRNTAREGIYYVEDRLFLLLTWKQQDDK